MVVTIYNDVSVFYVNALSVSMNNAPCHRGITAKTVMVLHFYRVPATMSATMRIDTHPATISTLQDVTAVLKVQRINKPVYHRDRSVFQHSGFMVAWRNQ